MQLDRISANFMHAHHAESDKYRVGQSDGEPSGWNVRVDFPQFGAGTDNFSQFMVSLGWSDVEAIIRSFSEIGHPEAARLQRARTLAAALDEFAKNSN